MQTLKNSPLPLPTAEATPEVVALPFPATEAAPEDGVPEGVTVGAEAEPPPTEGPPGVGTLDVDGCVPVGRVGWEG